MLKELLADTRKILKVFGLGALCFFIGVAVIQWANHMIPPSLRQEVFTLLGLIVGIAGFLIAITAQCLLITQRFQQMGNKTHKDNKD